MKTGQHNDAGKNTEVIGQSPYDERAYPNEYDDRNPLLPDIIREDFEVHKKRLVSFGNELYKEFVRVSNEEKELWMDVISTCRPLSIEAPPEGLTYKRCTFSKSRGVYADNGRETPRVEAIKRLLC